VKKQEREAFIKAVRECGLSLGEIVQEVEKKGMLGHFKSLKQSVYSSPEGGVFSTRDFWCEAGVDQEKIFTSYFGVDSKEICEIDDARKYVKSILNKVTDDILLDIKSTSKEKMLGKLLCLYSNVHRFYIAERKIREQIIRECPTLECRIFEDNRNIAITIINGLNIMIENCLIYSRDADPNEMNKYQISELFDSELLVRVYLYGLLSWYYTALNISKDTNRNYPYCKGIKVNIQKSVPIDGDFEHPIIYSNVLLFGNQTALMPKDIKRYLAQIDSTPIGKGFRGEYGLDYLRVCAVFYYLEERWQGIEFQVVSLQTLIRDIEKVITGFNGKDFVERFLISADQLKQYISEREPYIFRMGYNKKRLELCPLIRLNEEEIMLSSAVIAHSMHLWNNYMINGGRPYNAEIEGDSLIKGAAEREEELAKQMLDILMSKLVNEYPNPQYCRKNVSYKSIFGRIKGFEDTSDYDLVYFTGDELYLIESKYFSDSFTPNSLIGDFGKLFRKGKYYEHCRARYDLVEAYPDRMKDFLKTTSEIQVHYLFVSSKPLEVGLQDQDGMVTFLNLGNFEEYIRNGFKDEEGNVIETTHRI